MDFSKFSDENFDVKEWVNSALRVKDERTPVDVHASNLVMKLQLFIQEVNNALEETSQQTVNNIPRVLREIENVKNDASLLKEQMHLVKEDIKKVEENTSQSMKMLLELDSVKSRMQEASQGLQEADNWTTLSADVDKVFDSGDVQAIAAKLVGMHKSLMVLQDVPDYAQRRRLLEGLKNKLEALLSPNIVAAFNNHSLDDTREYVRIFTDIERLDQLQNYYIRCHKTKLQQAWVDAREEDPNRTMLEWLSTFYDVVLSTWHTEITWCSQVFPEPGTVLCLLLTQALTHLDPTLSSCIAEFIKDEPNVMEKLIDLRQVTLRFANGLENVLRQQEGKCNTSAVSRLVEDIYSPYTMYILDYSVLQQTYLTNQLQDTPLRADGFLETAGLLAESVEKVFLLAEQALDCCVRLTDGYSICSLTHVLEEFFSVYAGNLNDCMSSLRKDSDLDGELKNEPSGDDLHQDWTLFQNAFRLIQICGDLLLRMADLDKRLLRSALQFSEEGIGGGEGRPFGWYNCLQRERPVEYNALLEFVQRLQAGGEGALVLPVVREQLQALNERAHKLAFDIVFIQIKQQLSIMVKLKIWSAQSPESGAALSDALPAFSLSPLGYITHIGDYLLTLPQQLEPFVTQENPALEAAMSSGRLPYPDSQEEEQDAASYWLGSIARGTMHTYCESILRLNELTPFSALQILADIEYFCNVLEALEVDPSEQLKHIQALLRASHEEFHEVATELNVEDRIRIVLAGIRSIH